MLLALNTSTMQYGLALMEPGGGVVAEHFLAQGRGHYGHLMPALDFLLGACGVAPRDLQALAVAIGPGSFTGLRVGLTTAKGLSHALHLPLMGISSLEALARQIPFAPGPVAPVLTSRRGELFTALFEPDTRRGLVRAKADTSLPVEAFGEVFPGEVIFVGNDYAKQAPALAEAVGETLRLAPPSVWGLKASSIAALAWDRWQAKDFDDAVSLSPIYLRPPDIRPSPFPLRPDRMRPGPCTSPEKGS